MSAGTRNLFLCVENLRNLGLTIESFLYETYNIRLKSVISFSDFQELLQDVMQETEEEFPSLSNQEKNKKAIVSIRNIIFDRIRIQSQHQTPIASTTVTPPVPQGIIHDREAGIQGTDMPVPTPIERVSSKTEDSDEVFFKKLQDLEIRRKVPLSSPSGSVQPTQPAIPPPAPAHVTAPVVLSPKIEDSGLLQQPVQHVVVAVPPPPRHGITYIVSSWDRNILENPERSLVRWNRALPVLSDPMGTRISGLFLPALFASYTPYVSVLIEGAGGGSTTCLLSPEYVSNSRARGWIRWSPMDASLSYIKSVSMPWAIQLRSADGVLLPLGVDHYHVVSIAVDISIKTATLKLGSTVNGTSDITLNEGDFQAGDQIWIYTKNDKKKTEVLSVSKDSIDVRYNMPMKTPTISNSVHEWMNGRVLNYNRQWSLVVEVSVSSPSKD